MVGDSAQAQPFPEQSVGVATLRSDLTFHSVSWQNLTYSYSIHTEELRFPSHFLPREPARTPERDGA
jgi:hypothetical protein